MKPDLGCEKAGQVIYLPRINTCLRARTGRRIKALGLSGLFL